MRNLNLIRLADVKKYEKLICSGEITMSKFAELMNECANESLSLNYFGYMSMSNDDALRKELNAFCDHLNTYEGLEDCRFDFMLIDYLDKIQKK